MKNNILLVGLGNIGLRHLESLLKLPKNFIIYIYDKDRSKIIGYKESQNLILVSDLELIRNLCFEACVLATPATSRRIIIEKICNITSVKHWIIEKPIEQSIKNLNIISKITKKKYLG